MSNAQVKENAPLLSPAEIAFYDAVGEVQTFNNDTTKARGDAKTNIADLKALSIKATWLIIPLIAPINNEDRRIGVAEDAAVRLAKARGVAEAGMKAERQLARMLVTYFDQVAATPASERKKSAFIVARDIHRDEAKEKASRDMEKADRALVNRKQIIAEVLAASDEWTTEDELFADPAGDDAFRKAQSEAIARARDCQTMLRAWANLSKTDQAMFLINVTAA